MDTITKVILVSDQNNTRTGGSDDGLTANALLTEASEFIETESGLYLTI